MSLVVYVIFLAVSFGASVLGAICGIGGGILMKPLLDACNIFDVATISFLSKCTVFSMACYSVLKRDKKGAPLNLKISIPLALGAAAGGIVGERLFALLLSTFTNQNRVGAIQTSCLIAVTLGALIYTLYKKRIRTYYTENRVICVLIGLLLGLCSSFLGIGGGPINLVVLFFFFSMEMKTAAQNSLFVIWFSQAAGLLDSFLTGGIPEFQISIVILMVLGGIAGGMAGKRINKKIDSETVSKLFIAAMAVIIVICLFNLYRFLN